MHAFIVTIIAIVSCVTAYPQTVMRDANGNQLTVVDGFAFDGPVKPRPTYLPPIIQSDGQPVTNPPVTNRPSTGTTPAPQLPPNFDACNAACPATAEYNPVCGTDGVTYPNPGRLRCAAYCGRSVTLVLYGRCQSGPPRG